MSTPRVVFLSVVGGPRGSGAAAVAAGRSSGVVWRLLGANNRELGRSVRAGVTVAGCREEVGQLRASLDRLQTVVTRDATARGWTWSVLLDGEPVARSARDFARERESRYNVERFLAVLPHAHLPAVTEVGTLPRARADAFARAGRRRPIVVRVAL